MKFLLNQILTLQNNDEDTPISKINRNFENVTHFYDIDVVKIRMERVFPEISPNFNNFLTDLNRSSQYHHFKNFTHKTSMYKHFSCKKLRWCYWEDRVFLNLKFIFMAYLQHASTSHTAYNLYTCCDMCCYIFFFKNGLWKKYRLCTASNNKFITSV